MKFTYNQHNSEHNATCTIFSLYQIIYLQYNIKIPYTYTEKTVDLAVKMGVLFPGGAVFDTMYKWLTKRVKTKYGITLNVEKDSIGLKAFQKKQYYQAYGLYLINGNKEYLKAIEKGHLTKLDIDRIAKQGGGFKHNNIFYDGKIYEIYKGISVSCTVAVLRYAVKKGVYGSYARTLSHQKDKFHTDIFKNLNEFNKLELTTEEQEAFEIAFKLKYLLK